MEEKLLALKEKIEQWNQAYYENDAPTVSDAEYDQALNELIALPSYEMKEDFLIAF